MHLYVLFGWSIYMQILAVLLQKTLMKSFERHDGAGFYIAEELIKHSFEMNVYMYIYICEHNEVIDAWNYPVCIS